MKSDSQTKSQNVPSTFTEPVFRVQAIKLRQPDGSLLVKAGTPQIVAAEVSVTQFHKETGVSKRHIATLCEQGLIQHRRLTPKKDSKILIPRSEIDRYRKLSDDAGISSKIIPPLPNGGKSKQIAPSRARSAAK